MSRLQEQYWRVLAAPYVRHTNTAAANSTWYMSDREPGMRCGTRIVIDDAIWRLFAQGFHCVHLLPTSFLQLTRKR